MRWSDLKTRRLLRSVQRAPTVVADPDLAVIVARLGASSPRGAVEALVERALRPYPAAYSTLVRAVDLGGAPLDAVAERLGVSHRTAYRQRAAAIAVVGREIAVLLRDSALPPAASEVRGAALLPLADALLARRTHAALRRALEGYQAILATEPCAAAYAGIADVHLVAAESQLCDPAAALRLGWAAIEKGLSLDPHDAELHAVRADVRLLWRRTPRAARNSVRSALAADERCGRACLAAVRLGLVTGDLIAAHAFAQRGMGSGRDVALFQTLAARILAARNERESAREVLESVLRGDPSYADARFELARLFAATERYGAAREQLQRLMAEEARTAYAALLAYVAAREGETRPAVALLDGSEATLLIGHLGHYLRAYAFMGLRRHADALDALRLAARVGEPWAAFCHLDDAFAELRASESFALLRAA